MTRMTNTCHDIVCIITAGNNVFLKRLVNCITHGSRITLGSRSMFALAPNMFMRLITRPMQSMPNTKTICGDCPRLLNELLAIRGRILCGAEPVHAPMEVSTYKTVLS